MDLTYRELPGGGRQRKRIVELALEHLPQILWRVGADGRRRYPARI